MVLEDNYDNLKVGEVRKFKGIRELILEVDPSGGFMSIEVDKLKKTLSELKLSNIPPGLENRTLSDHYKLDPRHAKWKKTVEDYESAQTIPL